MTETNTNHTLHSYGIREDAREFPMMVVLSFVYICNAGCPYCPYNNSDIRQMYKDALYMSSSIFRRIADECGPFHSLLRISGGGEPMLHPNAEQLILYALDKGCRVGLITNGSNFNDQSLRSIINAGIDAIEFSVDAGDSQTYAMVRPKLNWEVLNRNIRLAVKIRNELDRSTRIVTSIINQKDVDVTAAQSYWEKIVDKVQVRKFLTWGYNQDNSADSTPYLPAEERLPCPWLFERLNIDSRGDVTLCGEDIAFNEKFGNIMDRSIQEIWKGPEFTYFREKHLARKGHEINICKTCPDWQYRSWKYNYWKVLEDAKKKRMKEA